MTETSTKASRPVFKTGLPHVAYVLLWYPLFTQPFIFREVEGLKGLLPLSVSKDRNPLKVLKRTVQWMVKQSTHVINGFYEDLFDRDDFVLNFAHDNNLQLTEACSIPDVA